MQGRQQRPGCLLVLCISNPQPTQSQSHSPARPPAPTLPSAPDAPTADSPAACGRVEAGLELIYGATPVVQHNLGLLLDQAAELAGAEEEPSAAAAVRCAAAGPACLLPARLLAFAAAAVETRGSLLCSCSSQKPKRPGSSSPWLLVLLLFLPVLPVLLPVLPVLPAGQPAGHDRQAGDCTGGGQPVRRHIHDAACGQQGPASRWAARPARQGERSPECGGKGNACFDPPAGIKSTPCRRPPPLLTLPPADSRYRRCGAGVGGAGGDSGVGLWQPDGGSRG